MNFSDLKKKLFQREKGFRTGSESIRRSASISGEFVIWALLIVVALVELFVLYKAVYLNFVFDDEVDPVALESTVRINFNNYNRVVERLDDVEDYEPDVIDFSGPGPDIGRSNPFADPE